MKATAAIVALWLAVFFVAAPFAPNAHCAGEARATAPRVPSPLKKPRKSRPAAAVVKPAVKTPILAPVVGATRFEEVELIPVPPPTPTPATELIE